MLWEACEPKACVVSELESIYNCGWLLLRIAKQILVHV